jgi:hypothetical protein
MADAGIVRNRLKVEATIANARAVLEVERQHGSFAGWLWGLVGGAPVRNSWRSRSQVPAETPAARALSRSLQQRGFRFVGPAGVSSGRALLDLGDLQDRSVGSGYLQRVQVHPRVRETASSEHATHSACQRPALALRNARRPRIATHRTAKKPRPLARGTGHAA